MNVSDFDYQLPDNLIARYPTPDRRGSRLMRLDGGVGDLGHDHFENFPKFVTPDDLLVFNNTRVIPARLYAAKETGGRVEIMVERVLDSHTIFAQLRVSKTPQPGSYLQLSEIEERLLVVSRQDSFFELQSEDGPILDLLEKVGHMPLPPYIDRPDEATDQERYQTVYASQPGAVAAPTAGLHFDELMLDELRAIGVGIAEITLHVGAGTFQPVRCEKVEDHHMHSEWIEVDASVCDQVAQARERGGRVIAVGTTALRSLESASTDGELKPMSDDSDIFIYPGYQFRCVDMLLTNFHLPRSTLLMLVSAFAGSDKIKTAYEEAISHEYRFFSYGDAMLISGAQPSLQACMAAGKV